MLSLPFCWIKDECYRKKLHVLKSLLGVKGRMHDKLSCLAVNVCWSNQELLILVNFLWGRDKLHCIHLWTCKLSKVMLLFSNYLFENKMVFSSEFNHIRNEYRNRNETITLQLRREGNQMHFFPLSCKLSKVMLSFFNTHKMLSSLQYYTIQGMSKSTGI